MYYNKEAHRELECIKRYEKLQIFGTCKSKK